MKYRCAIIGCGRIGCGFDDNTSQMKRTHISGYITNPKTQLIALSDIDNLKLKKYGKKYGISNLYVDNKLMFDKEQIDVISICTLADSHLEIVMNAAKRGIKGIFIEKPISNTLKNIKKIIEICKKNEIILAVDHQRRFEPFYHDLKNRINSGELGKIQQVIVFYGAGIANTGSHVFDLLRFFFGEIIYLSAKKSKVISPNPNDPNLDVILKFQEDFFGFIFALDLSNYGICEFQIFGTKGRLDIDLLSNKAKLFKPHSKIHDYKKLTDEEVIIDKTKKTGTILGIKDLIECITNKKTPMCTGIDGYKSVELIIASIVSSTTKKKINLPLKTNDYKIYSR